MTYTIGTTLSVPAGQGFSVSSATIADPLNCQGSIIATAGGAINLTNGLTLSGTGQVALGSGNLTISDSISGISGGSLAAATLYVASLSTGSFTQSAGTSSVSSNLYVGYGGSGTYSLSGSGLLLAPAEYVGYEYVGYSSGTGTFYSGTGTFTQSGGTNSTTNLYLSGASGTYNLSGSGLLLASSSEQIQGRSSSSSRRAGPTWPETLI